MRRFGDELARNSSGITLAELLVASVVLTISLIGAVQASRSALVASNRMDREGQTDGQIQDAFEALGRDLRCAQVVEGNSQMTFTGQAATMSFATLSGDVSCGWHPGAQPALRQVSWAMTNGKLTRAETALSGPGGSHTSEFGSKVAGLALQFYRGTNSGQEWNSDKELPTAVDVSLTVNDVSHHTLLRLPAGTDRTEAGQ
jgi:type II secretion system protein J